MVEWGGNRPAPHPGAHRGQHHLSLRLSAGQHRTGAAPVLSRTAAAALTVSLAALTAILIFAYVIA